jgi:hypothetical protein
MTMPKRKHSKTKTLTHKNAQRERQMEKTVQEGKKALEQLAKGGKHG